MSQGDSTAEVPADRTGLLIAGIWAALVALLVTSLFSRPGGHAWGLVIVFSVLVVLAENAGLRFPTPIAISPQTVFVMAAVVSVYHGHGTLVAVAVVGSTGGLLVNALKAHRVRLLFFNIGQMGLSAGLAAGVFRYLAGRTELVSFPATVIAYLIVNAGLVLAFTLLRTDLSFSDLWQEIRQSLVVDFVVGLAGLGVGELFVHVGVVALVIVVGAGVVTQITLLAVVRLRAAYRRIDVLYRFTKGLERSQDEPDALLSILTELRRTVGAECAELTRLSPTGWRRATLSPFNRRLTISEGPGRPVEVDAAAAGSALIAALPPDNVMSEAVTARVGSDAMIVAMSSEQGVLGTIVLARPTDRAFSVEDLRLLEALANHATVSLDNARLLGQLRYDSQHDPLTDLPNRRRFSELVDDLPQPSSVLLADLDRFRDINDTLGHDQGDQLLLQVAERIADEVGHRGIVARLGGDEFAVLLPQTGTGDAAQVAVSLLNAIERPFALGELELEMTASIGIAVSQTAVDARHLLQRADVAMYSAKSARSGWEVYSSERDQSSPRRLTLARELRHAIDDGQLEVHYQPKAYLAGGAVQGVEALVRWQHPTEGLLGPDEFVPIAENAGLIRDLTHFVLVDAVRTQKEIQALGTALTVSVNLSVRSVLDVNLPAQVMQVLREHGVAATGLTLEITESSVMADPARTIGVLNRLAQLGVAVSVDDFGTGYSSLAYLKRLPATEVKIDRTFVAGMLTNESDAAIVRSTVDLARNLGLQVVAEGVEDLRTWNALARVGCDLAQGYFISRPITSAALKEWLFAARPAVDPTV